MRRRAPRLKCMRSRARRCSGTCTEFRRREQKTMNSERWKQVDKLLQAALERPLAARAEFLRQACAGDEALEREVQSLLAAQQEAGSFLESPAMEVAAREIGRRQSEDAQESNI